MYRWWGAWSTIRCQDRSNVSIQSLESKVVFTISRERRQIGWFGNERATYFLFRIFYFRIWNGPIEDTHFIQVQFEIPNMRQPDHTTPPIWGFLTFSTMIKQLCLFLVMGSNFCTAALNSLLNQVFHPHPSFQKAWNFGHDVKTLHLHLNIFSVSWQILMFYTIFV